MDTQYSTIAVKYVGSTPALSALEALRAVEADGGVALADASVVTRSTGGEINCYPVRDVSAKQRALLGAAGGLVVGFFLDRRAQWALWTAMLGGASGWFSTRIARQRILAAAPFVEKNESVIYMRIQSADWPKFQVVMRPYLAQGLPVIRNIAPAHTALRELFTGATELQTPPQDEFPEPPTTGSLGPQEEQAGTEIRVQATDGVASPQSLTGPANTAPTAHDDFTELMGIGSVYQQRLSDAGVYTYDQLAHLTVAKLAEITGAPSSRVQADDWVGQATTRASHR